jgi:hypothetical protein
MHAHPFPARTLRKEPLFVLVLLLGWPTGGLSQAVPYAPRVALFSGFTRVCAQADPNSYSVGSFHFDGFEASTEFKFTRWVGIVGDYG